jgi:hypothetical protein
MLRATSTSSSNSASSPRRTHGFFNRMRLGSRDESEAFDKFYEVKLCSVIFPMLD